jgi:hypothetical protein
MRANGIEEIELTDSGSVRRMVVLPYRPDAPSIAAEELLGIPEALMKAKDDEAQRLRDAVDAQWAEDQVRYAHTSGYVQDEAPSAGVTRQTNG